MELEKFEYLLINGFDIEFNIDDVFFSFTSSNDGEKTIYLIGNENYDKFPQFDDIKDLLKYSINGKKIEEIINCINDDEVYY